MHLTSSGRSLVGYSCYMEDFSSIYTLNLPWTRPYIAYYLYTRLCKGFRPNLTFWTALGEDIDSNGLLLYLRECLNGTAKLKSRIRQLLTPSEGDPPICEADQRLDAFIQKCGLDLSAPLSYYDDFHLTGTTCLIHGHVERVFIGRSASSSLISEDNEDGFLKDVSMKRDKSDPMRLTMKIHRKGRIQPWEKGELKKRYFVVSDRFLYEYVMMMNDE